MGNISGSERFRHLLTRSAPDVAWRRACELGDTIANQSRNTNWNPSGQVGVYQDRPIGVFFNIGLAWAIFNQDSWTPMTKGSSFNMMGVDKPNMTEYVHVVNNSNIWGSGTLLDHPALNNNPQAIFHVTQNRAPQNVFNNKNIGVWYVGPRWAVFNEDESSMPLGAAFNISVSN